MANIKEQKKRTYRLIERGAILESFIEGADEKSNEEIKGILQELFKKADRKDKRQAFEIPSDFLRAQLYILKGVLATCGANTLA